MRYSYTGSEHATYCQYSKTHFENVELLSVQHPVQFDVVSQAIDSRVTLRVTHAVTLRVSLYMRKPNPTGRSGIHKFTQLHVVTS